MTDSTERRVAIAVILAVVLVVAALLGYVTSKIQGDPLPHDKRAAVIKTQAMEQKAREAKAAAKPAQPEPPAVAAATEPERVWGLMSADIGPVPAAARGTELENKWLGQVGGVLVALYAGHDLANPQQGVLVVFWPGGEKAPLVCRSPQPLGSFRIVSVQGTTVALQSGVGPLSYDLATGVLGP